YSPHGNSVQFRYHTITTRRREGSEMRLDGERRPTSARPEEPLDRFADGAAAAGPARGPVGEAPNFEGAVGRRQRQADLAQQRQVGQIVAHEGDLGRPEAVPGAEVGQERGLVAHALVDLP